MAITTIEPITAYIPPSIPKSQGFTFFPPGTIRVHSAKKWALYYYPGANVSYMVVDVGTAWRVTTMLGKVKLSFAKSHAKSFVSRTPCCQDED